MCCYYYFREGQARRRPSPKGAEALLGGRGGRRGPARLWHDCRAPGCHFVTVAVVAVGGRGAEPCAIAPTAPDVEAAGEAGSGDPRWCSGPLGGFPPRDNGLRLCWSVAAAVALGGRRSSLRVLPPHRAPYLPRPSSRQCFALPPAGVLDVVKCGPKDVLVAPVFALSEELIGGLGEKLNMRFLFREGGRARDSSGPEWSQGQQPLTREGRVVDVLGKRPPGLGSPGR